LDWKSLRDVFQHGNLWLLLREHVVEYDWGTTVLGNIPFTLYNLTPENRITILPVRVQSKHIKHPSIVANMWQALFQTRACRWLVVLVCKPCNACETDPKIIQLATPAPVSAEILDSRKSLDSPDSEILSPLIASFFLSLQGSILDFALFVL
jgi:hypothetical protein